MPIPKVLHELLSHINPNGMGMSFRATKGPNSWRSLATRPQNGMWEYAHSLAAVNIQDWDCVYLTQRGSSVQQVLKGTFHEGVGTRTSPL